MTAEQAEELARAVQGFNNEAMLSLVRVERLREWKTLFNRLLGDIADEEKS